MLEERFEEKFEELAKKFETYCSELGGKFRKGFWPRSQTGELSPYGELECVNVRRIPDPARVVDLAKEARESLKKLPNGEIYAKIFLLFSVAEDIPSAPGGFISMKVSRYGMESLALKKEKPSSFAWSEPFPSTEKLRSIMRKYEEERLWSLSWNEGKDSLRFLLRFYPEDLETWSDLFVNRWTKADWSRVETILREAKKVLEWGISPEQVIGGTS